MKFSTTLFFGILMCVAIVAQADPRRWGDDGIPLRRGYYLNPEGGWYGDSETAVAQNEAGQSLLVWTDMHTGSRDIYAQLYSAAGGELWADPVVIISGTRYQDFPEVVAVEGGWIIAWKDFRYDNWCGGEENLPCSDIFAQKLDDSGNLLWPDNEWTGVAVDVSPNSGPWGLHLADDGTGGALIAWADNPLGIYAQHVSTNGIVLWPQRLIVTDSTYRFDATGDGNGNMLFAWRQETASQVNIFASKLTTDGGLPWGPEGVPIDDAGSLEVKICSDGTDGCYIAWQADNPVNLRAQHLNSNGEAQWTVGGVFICNAPNLQEGLQITASAIGGTPDGLLAAWTDRRINAEVEEVYGQKLSLAGSPLWSVNGIHIAGDATPQGGHSRHSARVASDQQGGMLCDWSDTRNIESSHSAADLYAARILADGTALWGAEGVPVAEPTLAQLPISILLTNEGCWIPFYEGYYEEVQSIRHQLLDLNNGSPWLADDGVAVVSGISGAGSNPRLISLAGGRTGIVWEDARGNSVTLWYKIIEPDGSSQQDLSGAHLVLSENPWQGDAALCDDGEGGFFVAYQDQRTGIQQIRVSHVNSNGDVVDSDTGVIVYDSPSQHDQIEPRIASDGSGGCYIAWSQYDQDFIMDLYVTRMSATLEPMWESPLRLAQSQEDDQAIGVVKTENGCAIVWHAGPDNQQILSAGVNSEGVLAWNLVVIEQSDLGLEWTTAISDGEGGFYCAWRDLRGEEDDIYAQHVSSSGQPLWTPNGLPVCTALDFQIHPQIALSSNGGLIVTWIDNRNGATHPLYAQILSAEGEALWDDQGLPVTDSELNEASLPLADSEGGFFFTWEQYDNDVGTRIYAQHIDADGSVNDDPFWQSGTGSPISTVEMMLENGSLASDGAGGCIAGWSFSPEFYVADQYGRDIHIQRLNDILASADPHVSSLPETYALYQNYPNPFNPTTTIAFDLPQASDVELKVFDLLGREVKSLVNQSVAAGHHAVQLDASGLPSGLYVYRINAGSFSESRKLVILK